MSNEQKPSAEAIQIIAETVHEVDSNTCTCNSCCASQAERIDELLARVRREARAEAFEEVQLAAATAVNLNLTARAVADRVRELAGKERAK